MLGGFHFNDRRYADDDLTLGSIDPYQVFRIFHEILFFEWETGKRADIAYMIDQSHNLKGKIEAMIQTVNDGAGTVCQGRFGDHDELVAAQKVSAHLCAPNPVCRTRFPPTSRPLIREWRASKGLPADPHGSIPRKAAISNAFRSNAPPATCPAPSSYA